MTIDGNISDLFFNLDLSATTEHDLHGNFTGYNDEALAAEAAMFLGYLYRLGVAVPTPEELIEDFMGRQ